MTNTSLLIRIALISIINLAPAVPVNCGLYQTFKMKPVDIPRPDETSCMYHNGNIIAELSIPKPQDEAVVMKAVSGAPGRYKTAYYIAFDPVHERYRIPFKIELGKAYVPDYDVADRLHLIHLEKNENAPPPEIYQGLMNEALAEGQQPLPGRNRDATDLEMKVFSTDEEIKSKEFWWRLKNPGHFLLPKLVSLLN